MIEQAALIACLMLALIAAAWDVRKRRIPNLLCAAMAVCSIGYLVLSSGLEAAGSGALHAVVALVAGMMLFGFGMIGGGDAKFYAASAFAVPLGGGLFMLGATSLVGLALLLLMAALRMLGFSAGPRDARGRVLVPYGVAIAGGFAFTALAAPSALS